MINQLPLMSRTAFNLYVIEGYKHMEIAEELQISEGTSKWHLSFVRQKLRDLINNKEKQNKKIMSSNKKSIDDLFKDRLLKEQTGFNPAHWDKMAGLLDKQFVPPSISSGAATTISSAVKNY